MSTEQEYWDACLIRTWRNHGETVDAMRMFVSITGKRTDAIPLLRVPVGHFPDACRVFVANWLPKISEWLLKCGPEHDVTLLKRLSASKYDVQKVPSFLPDPEKKHLYQVHAKNKQVMKLARTMAGSRNSDTDWSTVKGSARRRAVR